MSRPKPPPLPTRNGVSPSCVALPPGPWATVLDFFEHRIPIVPRHEWQQRMQQGDVVTDHAQPVHPQAPYAELARQHGRLFYWRSLAHEPRIPFEERVVFQDDWLVVADKPHFLPVTPKGSYVQETLLVRLKRKLGIDTLAPMHRLDRETAGLVAFSIQPHTRDAYQRLFRDRLVHKVYEAIAPTHASMQWPHTRSSRMADGDHFMTMVEVEGEPNAHTHIECLGSVAHTAPESTPLSLYRLQPVTGQRHQLRVHMNALGLPIVGDRIYPTLLPNTPADQQDYRQPLQLLARSLSFTDPVTGSLRQFRSGRKLSLGPCSDLGWNERPSTHPSGSDAPAATAG